MYKQHRKAVSKLDWQLLEIFPSTFPKVSGVGFMSQGLS